MSDRKIPIDPVHLTELIRNPVIVRIVSILDLASLSILELLEYNLERREINYALSEGSSRGCDTILRLILFT